MIQQAGTNFSSLCHCYLLIKIFNSFHKIISASIYEDNIHNFVIEYELGCLHFPYFQSSFQ